MTKNSQLLAAIGVSLFCFAGTAGAQSEAAKPRPIGTNLISLLRFPDSPEAKLAGHYPLKEKLKDAKVPTEQAAESAALKARAGLPGNEGFEVTALLWLGRDEPDFGKRDDLVWEVRFFNGHTVTGLLWINAITGAVKVLLEPRQK